MIGDGYDAERADLQNLRDGILFEGAHPEISCVTCAQCRVWWFDPLTGQTARDLETRQPLKRPAEATVLCETEIGCVRGHYSAPKGLSDKNRAAVLHYEQCRRAGVFPDDPIVARNRIVIEDAKRVIAERQRQDS